MPENANSETHDPTDTLSVVAASLVYGDHATGPLFALRQWFAPAGIPLERAIYRTFALLSAAFRGCHKVEVKKFPSVQEAQVWIGDRSHL